MALDRRQSTTSLDSSKEQPLLGQHPHPSPREVEIRNHAPNIDVTNKKSLRIPNMNPITTPRIHIPSLITLNTIRHTTTAISKKLPPRKLRTTIHNIVLVNRARQARVEREVAAVAGRAVRLDGARVGHVQFLVVRAEAEAVALRETVGYAPELAGEGLEAVDLGGELGGKAEGLFVAVGWIWLGVLVIVRVGGGVWWWGWWTYL